MNFWRFLRVIGNPISGVVCLGTYGTGTKVFGVRTGSRTSVELWVGKSMWTSRTSQYEKEVDLGVYTTTKRSSFREREGT